MVLKFLSMSLSRDGIRFLWGRSYISGTMGLQASVVANTGQAESEGFEVAMNYNKFFSNQMWTQLRANLTYATSNVLVYDEPNYPANEYYRSRVGYPINQQWGYIAERLFIDEYEVENSPAQNFGSGKEAEYGAGRYQIPGC